MSIVARELSRQYGSVCAVDRASFSIEAGTIAGLIGPNGSGKTTILRMLSGFLTPSAGSAELCGCDVIADRGAAQRHLGYLPENPPGCDDARVAEFLAFRAQLKGIPRRERGAEIARCLECCDLAPVRHRLIGRLSQGFRRRVGLAEALLGAPRVLLLDEPTSGLDPLQVRQTRNLLSRLAPQCTIVLSTHLLAEAEAVCSRAVVLVSGRIVSDVALDELRAHSSFEVEVCGPHEECRAFLGGRAGVKSVAPAGSDAGWHRFVVHCERDLREPVARELFARGWAVRELHAISRPLEEHFLRVALSERREAA